MRPSLLARVGWNGLWEPAAAWLGPRDCRWVDIPLAGRFRLEFFFVTTLGGAGDRNSDKHYYDK